MERESYSRGDDILATVTFDELLYVRSLAKRQIFRSLSFCLTLAFYWVPGRGAESEGRETPGVEKNVVTGNCPGRR